MVFNQKFNPPGHGFKKPKYSVPVYPETNLDSPPEIIAPFAKELVKRDAKRFDAYALEQKVKAERFRSLRK